MGSGPKYTAPSQTRLTLAGSGLISSSWTFSGRLDEHSPLFGHGSMTHQFLGTYQWHRHRCDGFIGTKSSSSSAYLRKTFLGIKFEMTDNSKGSPILNKLTKRLHEFRIHLNSSFSGPVLVFWLPKVHICSD